MRFQMKKAADAAKIGLAAIKFGKQTLVLRKKMPGARRKAAEKAMEKGRKKANRQALRQARTGLYRKRAMRNWRDTRRAGRVALLFWRRYF